MLSASVVAVPPSIRRSAPVDAPDPCATDGVDAPVESMHVMVDASGSMAAMGEAVFRGAAELVESVPDEARVRVSYFNREVQTGSVRTKSECLEQLGRPRCGGSTSLYDAIVSAVECEEHGPASTTTTIVVVTDGIDNTSMHTVADARAAVARAHAKAWRVLFVGANQDAVLAAEAFGIPNERALTFGATADNVRSAFRAVSENALAYRSDGTDAFTPIQRSASLTLEHGPPAGGGPAGGGSAGGATRSWSSNARERAIGIP